MADKNNLLLGQKLTVESSVRDESKVGQSVIFSLVRAGQAIHPWWSKSRDEQLRAFWADIDIIKGAFWNIGTKVSSVPFTVVPKDISVKAHVRQADDFNVLLHDAPQHWQGWADFWLRFWADAWTTDNGGFGEIIGEGKPDGPRKGPPVGLAHLDSLRCTRSSNPVFPVIYQASDGKRFKFHYTRVIYASQFPSTQVDMNGVGYSWMTRAINKAQRLLDIDTYMQEALGSRPKRQLMTVNGMDTVDVVEAFKMADAGMDNEGLSRYSKTVVLADAHQEITANLIDFNMIPDGFDEDTTTRLAAIVVALTGGFPARWIWPALTAGATKADAMFQHVSGQGGGMKWHLDKMAGLLSYMGNELGLARFAPPKFLPPSLKIEFDFQDDEQDKRQADIRNMRATTREVDLADGVINIRVAREQALAAEDLTRAQFRQLELDEGRLENGDDIFVLFAKEEFTELLDLGVEDPLLIDVNDPLEMLIAIDAAALLASEVLVTANSTGERRNAQEAIAALGKLKEAYNAVAVRDIQLAEGGQEEEEEETEESETDVDTETDEGETEEEEPEEESEEETAEELKAAYTGLRMIEKEIVAADKAIKESGDPYPSTFYVDDMLMKFNFGASVGEIIRGRLFRGAGGKFASEADVQAAKSEILAKLIERLRAKRASKTGGAKKKPKVAKKPKKPKGGKASKPKVTAEEKRRQKGMDEANKRSAVLGTIAGDFGLEEADFEALQEFTGKGFRKDGTEITGKDLDPEQAKKLAQAGLVKFDSEGRPQMTSAGRAALSAGSKNDKRKAQGALSRAQEQVKKTQDRASDKRESANEKREKASKLNADANKVLSDANTAVEKLSADLKDADDEDKAKIQEKIDAAKEKAALRAEKLRVRAEKENTRASESDADADELEASIGGRKEKSVYLKERPLLCGKVSLELKQEDGPPRGDFEDSIADDLDPIFDTAREETLSALMADEQPDYAELRERLLALMIPLLVEAALFQFENLEDQFALSFDETEAQEMALAWAQQHAETLSGQLIQTTEGVVSRAQRQADEGATEDEVAVTVDRAFNETRQERIGKTEATVALTFGALLYKRFAARQDVEIELIWFTRLDELVCPICAPLHNTVITDQEPPAHVQCRCGVVARVKR